MKRLLVFFLTIVSLQAAAQAEQLPMAEFDPGSLGANDVLLDVRTPAEYGQGHLPDAVNIDWFAGDFNSQLSAIPKDATIYLYCKKGGRSALASERLMSLGYGRVVDLTGGFDAYTPPD